MRKQDNKTMIGISVHVHVKILNLQNVSLSVSTSGIIYLLVFSQKPCLSTDLTLFFYSSFYSVLLQKKLIVLAIKES